MSGKPTTNTLSTPELAPGSASPSSGGSDLASSIWNSFKYDFVTAPVEGFTQLVDHFSGKKDEQLTAPPDQGKPFSTQWFGNMIGGTAAIMAQMAIFHRLVGPGAAADMESSADYGLGKLAVPYIGKSFAAGAVMGGLLTPVKDNGNTADFLGQRLLNAGLMGLTFGSMTAGSIGLKSTGSAFLGNDLVAGGLSGILGGEVNSDGRSLATTGHLASWSDRLDSISAYGLGGAFGGAVNLAHEYIEPTTGIRGVRTFNDMKSIADSTVKPDHPAQWQYIDNMKVPPKTDALLETGQDPKTWYDRAAVALRKEVENSPLTTDERKLVVSGNQELGYALDEINGRGSDRPIITVYGSARFKPNTFQYQLARAVGGMAAEHGYDVMTGGGPGNMEAANRGAYEAGGHSIGIVIKLPHEPDARGNGFTQTTILNRNFYTRMQALKASDAFVVTEGGIGTGAEALDTLTQIQTAKMANKPVYFLGSNAFDWFDQMMRSMTKGGTVSPSDRNMYKIVDDPRDIFLDLAQRRAAQSAPQATDQPAHSHT